MKRLIVIVIICVLFLSCSKDPLKLCEKRSCDISAIFPGVVEISAEGSDTFFMIRDGKLIKLQMPENGAIPFALSSDMSTLAVKTSDESFIKLKMINPSEGSVKNTVELPENFTSVQSGCFLDNNRLAFLHIDETDDLARRYVVSVSTSEKLDDFDSYLIREENTKEFITEYLSLGSIVERPVALQCWKKELYIISSSVFSDMVQITAYEFDLESRKLKYLTAFHPVKPESRFDMYLDPASSTLYIFNNKRELVSVKENFFPVTRKFNEPGSIFFSPFSQSGFTISFMPDRPVDGKKDFRTVNISELPEKDINNHDQ